MKLLAKYMPVLLLLVSILGTLLPNIGQFLFPILPYGLWVVMTVTLIGIDQRRLLVSLVKKWPWHYSIVHSFVLLAISFIVCLFLPISHDLKLAIMAMTASGTIFSTPAIARIVGLNVMDAMILTIATTLISPIALVFAMLLNHNQHIELDFYRYFIKFLIFIIGPMLVAYLSIKIFGERRVCSFHQKITPFISLLVLIFPLGLSSQVGHLLYTSPRQAGVYLLIGFIICIGCFFMTYWFYKKMSLCDSMIRAIASGNRNALLTYTIAGPMLGSAFLPLMGAMQIPLNILPILVIIIVYYTDKKNKEVL